MTFDDKSRQTIANLKKEFGVEIAERKPIICNEFTVGIEIEVKFKYLFPEIHQKYFNGKLWKEYSYEEQQEINKEIELIEEDTRNKLQKTVECGIPKGCDKYWEFAINPANDLSLIIQQVDILRKINLIPSGRHSLHITIGGPTWFSDKKTKPLAYYVLMILELLYCDKARMAEGFDKDNVSNATWAKKGMAGICEKNQYDLSDQTVGFEFRTLILKDDTNLEELFEMMLFIIFDERGAKLVSAMREKMTQMGLPDKNWKRPSIEPAIWKLYIEKFDELASDLKLLLK